MKMKQINIGLRIQQRINELGVSKAEFARRINIPSQNINRILESNKIDTDKLVLISEALDYDFFKEFCDSDAASDNTLNNVHNSNVAIGENIDIKTTCKKDAAAEAKTSENSKMVEVLLEMVRSQKETIEQLTELCRKMGEKK